MSLIGISVTIPDLSGLSAAITGRVEAIVAETAHAAEAGIKASMAEPKTGRTYSIGNVTRALSQRERAGVTVVRQFGQTSMRTGEGLRVTQNATGTGFNVILGARIHRASAPGESPAIDTGALVNSIQSRQLGPMQWAVVAGTEYAKPLEYGTAKMAARPFMRPAADALRQPFIDAIREAVRP